MCTLITSKGTDIDENIANQNHATRTRTPKPGYLNLSIIEYWHYLPCPRITFKIILPNYPHIAMSLFY